MEKQRPVVITGNWKMYKTIEESTTFVETLLPIVQDCKARVCLAVPFTAIKPLADLAQGSLLSIGAQNMHDLSEGAFTGEIAGRMLKEAGASFVIIGHSERRRLFHETNSLINQKIKRALSDGLQPLLCVGETLEQRQQGQTESVLDIQLKECLADIKEEHLTTLMLGYEPVWAIGTDEVATPEQAQMAHQFCRNWLSKSYSHSLAEQIVIQYGGSVKSNNVSDLMEQSDIDGLLVGGSSLSIDEFIAIIHTTDRGFL